MSPLTVDHLRPCCVEAAVIEIGIESEYQSVWNHEDRINKYKSKLYD